MPRLAGGAPRGGTAIRLTAMRQVPLVLRRSGSNLSAQSFYLDWTAKGREILMGAATTVTGGNQGFGGGNTEGVTLYGAADCDVAVGDVFAHDGAQYLVEYVGAIGRSHVSGSVIRMAWASAQRAA